MHPETPETSNKVLSSQNNSIASTPPSQHGNSHNQFEATPATLLEEHGSSPQHDSSSEWSFSTSTSTPSDDESHLNAVDAFLSQRALYDDDDLTLSITNGVDTAKRLDEISKALIDHTSRASPIQKCSQELLLHILSYLPATDLLTVKLVSRRLYDLANSPYAWISAFSKYFPASAMLKTPRTSAAERGHPLEAKRRPFTRLSPVASWTSEYLLRTKLLRCIERGRPSLPCAAPSQGKPHKGFATFSFHSRLRVVTHLDAKFGPVSDKRLPQFIHGSSSNGQVSISDRRGELSGWGLNHNAVHFSSFEDVYPATSMWGAGNGEVVGLPNVMDLSSSNGMIYGEGFPGGYAFFMANNERGGRILAPFTSMSSQENGMPLILHAHSTICSVWISQALSIPRQTVGLVGMLTGHSCGVVSAYSLGLVGDKGEKLSKGELTARWILSPGVPIISLQADQNSTLERADNSRVWAVALNALGEIFYLTSLPKRHPPFDSPETDPELLTDKRAWATGKSAPWRLVHPSQREHRPNYDDETLGPPSYLPSSTWTDHSSPELPQLEFNVLQRWLTQTPSEIKGKFNHWDMRRRLEVDFAADDGGGAGETVLVFQCGYADAFDDSQRAVDIRRYVRQIGITTDSQITLQQNSPLILQSEWHSSNLVFGQSKNFKITATAMDCSKFAVTTISEDSAMWYARLAEQAAEGKLRNPKDVNISSSSPPKIPGQRARIVAAGTTTGQIYLWNARAGHSSTVMVTNDISPLRIINTSSPSISSVALSALYLVHGGSEGLVQAWDPLGSTTQPIRTICSALNRRALLAAQQDPNHLFRNYGAVGAICLDPDPNNLRGIAALGRSLRYWSYSSSSLGKDTSKAQKRNAQRAARGVKPSPSEGFMGSRRMDLKGFVSQEIVARGIEEQERRAEEKKHRQMNGRFGIDLLGSDASEEELIAYAKLLSEEEQEKQHQKSMEKHLDKHASEAEVSAHVSGLSLDDYEKWKYASWEERFAMTASESGSNTQPTTTSATSTPYRTNLEADDDLARAMELSLNETLQPASASVTQSSSNQKVACDDVEEAIRRSLHPSEASTRIHYGFDTKVEAKDQDLEEAIRLSLQNQSTSSPATGKLPRSGSLTDEDDFPPLGSSPMSSPPTWGKGKRRA